VGAILVAPESNLKVRITHADRNDITVNGLTSLICDDS
jgi:hypothetical protein